MKTRTARQFLSLAIALACVPAQAQQDHADHACVRDIHKFVTFREPDSIRIVTVSNGKMEVIDYMEKRLVAVAFTLTVSSKNSQGGYDHPRTYTCWTSEDRQRVLEYKPRRD